LTRRVNNPNMLEIQTCRLYMKQTAQLQTQIKKTLSPIIQGRLLKVNSWQELRVKFETLDTAERLEILDEVQKAMDQEVKKQFEKVQKARTLTGYHQPESTIAI